MEAYLTAEHIAYRPNGTTDLVLQQTLLAAGILSRRRVVFCAAHSSGLGQTAATSDLLLTLPRRLAERLVALQPLLIIRPVPFMVTSFEIRQQWHARRHLDGGNRWLRQLIFQLFHEPSQHARSVEPGMPSGLPMASTVERTLRH